MAINVPQIGVPNSLAQLLMNPKQVNRLAQQMANLQYGDTISTIRQGTRKEGTRHEQALADLASWFSQAQGQNSQSLDANKSRVAELLKGHDAAMGGLAAMSGGDAGVAHAVSGAAGAARGGLEGIGAAQQNFQQNLGTIMGMQQNDARIGETRRFDDRSSDLQAALSQALTQRGNAAAQNRMSLTDQNFRNRIAAMDAGLAQALGGPQVASAMLGLTGQQLDNQGKRVGLRGAALANQGAGLANQGVALDNQIKNIQIAAGLIDLKSPREKDAAQIPEFNGLMPDQLQGLEESLLGRVVLKDHPDMLGVNPIKAWSDMGNALRRLSNGKWNPKENDRVNSWRNGLVRERIASWNKQHPQKKYTWKGGRPVFIGDGKPRAAGKTKSGAPVTG